MKRKLFTLMLLMLAALAFSGCGGSSGPVEVSVQMSEFAFTPTSFTVPAGGEVNLTLVNSGALEHNFFIMKAGTTVVDAWADSDAVNAYFQHEQTPAGETVPLTFTAPTEPGEYQYLCSVPAHLQQGMQGIMTVTAP